MAAENYVRSLARVLVYEGGYSNHPADPGGPTNKGIIQRVYDAYRDSKGLPRRSVKELEESELQEIYRKQYWNAVSGDQLPSGVDHVVFDGAVNSGPSQSAKWLQRALNIPADGHIGIITLQAANAVQNKDRLVDGICDQRMAFLRSLRTFSVFGAWGTRRVADVRSVGKSWVNNTTLTPIVASSAAPSNAKATEPERTPTWLNSSLSSLFSRVFRS